MTRPASLSPLALIGGPRALSWQAWLLCAALMQLTAFAWSGRGAVVPNQPSALLGSLAAGGVLLLAGNTLLSHREFQAAKPAVVLGVWFLAYLVRGVVSDISNFLTSDVIGPHPIARILVAAVTLVGWTWIVTYYLALTDHYRGVAAGLSVSAERLQILNRQVAHDIDEMRLALVQAVESAIRPALGRLDLQLEKLDAQPSHAELMRLSRAADDQARRLVRDVSHQVSNGELALSTPSHDPGTIRPIAQASGTSSSMQLWRPAPGWSLAIALLSFLPVALTFGGVALVGRALAGIVPWALATVLLSHWQRPIMRATHVSALSFTLAASAGALAFGALIQRLILGSTFLGMANAVSLTWFWLGLLLVVVVSTAMTYALDRLRHDGEVLAQRVDECQGLTRVLEARAEPLRQQVAQILHGPTQGRLAAVSLTLRLQAEVEHDDSDRSWSDAIERCRTLLRSLNHDLETLSKGNVAERITVVAHIDLLRQRWAGLLVVQGDLSPDVVDALPSYPALERRACAMIEEGIHNACTHGRASTVRVRVGVHCDFAEGNADSGVSRVLDIAVSDDGVGPPPLIQPGHGLTSLSAMGGSWRLQADPRGGTTLAVRVPFPPRIEEPIDQDFPRSDGFPDPSSTLPLPSGRV